MRPPRAFLAAAVVAAFVGTIAALRGCSRAPVGTAGPPPPNPVGSTPPGAPGTLAAAPRPAPEPGPRSAPATPSPAEAPEPELDPADRPADVPDGVRTVRLRTRIVDALTGAAIATRWKVHEPTQAGPPPDATPPAPAAPDPRRWVDGRPRGPDHAATLVQAEWDRWLDVDVPPGYARAVREPVPPALAAGITDVEVVVPLHPVGTLVVTVLGPDGAPAAGAELVTGTLDGALQFVRSPRAGPDGVVRIENLPRVAGAVLVAYVAWREDELVPAPSPDPAPDAPEEPPEPPQAMFRFDVPAVPDAPLAATVRLAGPTAAPETVYETEIIDHFETDNDRPGDAPPGGEVVATVLDADGRRLHDVAVGCGERWSRSDAAGVARFPSVRAQRTQAWTFTASWLRAVADVEVRVGAVTEVVLQEPHGGRLDVEVVDADGRPVPTVAVRLRTPRTGGAVPWFDVRGGVQRLDAFTDARGRRTFARVQPGPVEVAVDGPGSAAVVVAVEDRGRVTATVVRR